MRPKRPEAENGDLFEALEAIHGPEHKRIRLAELINWDRIDDAFGTSYHEAKELRGLRTRRRTGLQLLKHMKGLSDEGTCAVWVENPYFQAFFCGEVHFQHKMPIDRCFVTRRRMRIGAEALEPALAETIGVAIKSGAMGARQLERITSDRETEKKMIQ